MARTPTFGNSAYVMLSLASLFWAGNHIVGRAIAGHVPPAGLSVFRWLLVTLMLLPFARKSWRHDWAGIARRPGAMVMLALSGGALFGTGQLVALNYTFAVNVAVINSVAPALIVLASVLIFTDQVRALQLFGIAVSLIGVLVIVSHGNWSRLATMTFNPGDLLVLFNMAVWAVYSACLRLKPDISAVGFMLALAAISAVANVPFAVWEHAAGHPLQLSWPTVLAIIYTGVFTSVLAYLAWSRGVELIGAPRAGAFLHLVPLYGAALAWVFLGERMQAFHIVGLVLILSGVTLAARRS
jgi:drug/metabolite transporter (DMT)-like permease